MLDNKIAKEKKALMIHSSLFAICLLLLLLDVLHGWVAQAVAIALCTRILYGLVVLSKLKQDAA
ncbi:MAG TPA: hypothetical protein DE179_12340 [Oceanospirillaceae bacterium]|nr:hypothetical protein [Oceanospirillaceae bacterium]